MLRNLTELALLRSFVHAESINRWQCMQCLVTRCEADEGMMINCVLRSHFQHLSLFSPDEY